jgi:thiamine pyrophosphate-dependent acetolactate synthase large subunit-like protein
MMNIQELETAVRYNLSLIVLVFNDFSFGMTRLRQKNYYNKRYIGTKHFNPDFAELAETFKARGVRVEKPDELNSALQSSLKSNKTTILDIIINRDIEPPIYV